MNNIKHCNSRHAVKTSKKLLRPAVVSVPGILAISCLGAGWWDHGTTYPSGDGYSAYYDCDTGYTSATYSGTTAQGLFVKTIGTNGGSEQTLHSDYLSSDNYAESEVWIAGAWTHGEVRVNGGSGSAAANIFSI